MSWIVSRLGEHLSSELICVPNIWLVIRSYVVMSHATTSNTSTWLRHCFRVSFWIFLKASNSTTALTHADTQMRVPSAASCAGSLWCHPWGAPWSCGRRCVHRTWPKFRKSPIKSLFRPEVDDTREKEQKLKVKLPYEDDWCCVCDDDSLSCDGWHDSNRTIWRSAKIVVDNRQKGELEATTYMRQCWEQEQQEFQHELLRCSDADLMEKCD